MFLPGGVIDTGLPEPLRPHWRQQHLYFHVLLLLLIFCGLQKCYLASVICASVHSVYETSPCGFCWDIMLMSKVSSDSLKYP